MPTAPSNMDTGTRRELVECLTSLVRVVAVIVPGCRLPETAAGIQIFGWIDSMRES